MIYQPPTWLYVTHACMLTTRNTIAVRRLSIQGERDGLTAMAIGCRILPEIQGKAPAGERWWMPFAVERWQKQQMRPCGFARLTSIITAAAVTLGAVGRGAYQTFSSGVTSMRICPR